MHRVRRAVNGFKNITDIVITTRRPPAAARHRAPPRVFTFLISPLDTTVVVIPRFAFRSRDAARRADGRTGWRFTFTLLP